MIMATTKKVAPKKVAPKKAAPKKVAAKKATAKKATAKKAPEFSIKQSAEKAVNVYFGVIGQGIDLVKENLETARKENGKRVTKLEKRGAKLRTEMTKRIDKVELPEFDAKAQFNKVQGQVEGAVESVKEKLKAA
jgi:hypothetical protein